jgi:hypothetical protein
MLSGGNISLPTSTSGRVSCKNRNVMHTPRENYLSFRFLGLELLEAWPDPRQGVCVVLTRKFAHASGGDDGKTRQESLQLEQHWTKSS